MPREMILLLKSLQITLKMNKWFMSGFRDFEKKFEKICRHEMRNKIIFTNF